MEDFTKVAHSESAGEDLDAQEASVKPAIAPTLLWLLVFASALHEDLGDARASPVALRAGYLPHRTADLHLGRKGCIGE